MMERLRKMGWYQFIIICLFIALSVGLVSCEGNSSIPGKRNEISLAEAENQASQGHFEDALGIYNQLILEGKSPDLAYFGRASLLMTLRRFDEAIQDYTKSLEINKSAATFASRCTAYRILNVMDKAVQDCEEAIRVDPSNVDAMLALTFLYLEQGNYDGARTLVDQVVKNYPDNPMGFFALSRLEMVQGSPEKAIEALTRAIEINPMDPQFYWERGFLFYSNGMINESEADMQKLIEVAVPERDSELMMMAGNLMNTYSGSRTPTP
jgi:tetratricopeptide (TPR) repeat protein